MSVAAPSKSQILTLYRRYLRTSKSFVSRILTYRNISRRAKPLTLLLLYIFLISPRTTSAHTSCVVRATCSGQRCCQQSKPRSPPPSPSKDRPPPKFHHPRSCRQNRSVNRLATASQFRQLRSQMLKSSPSSTRPRLKTSRCSRGRRS